MENDTQRPPFLMRTVVLPHWLQAVLLTLILVSLIRLMITNPALLIALAVYATVVGIISNIVASKRKDDVKQEVKEPVNLWNHLRTWKVWLLIIMSIAFSLQFLSLVSLIVL